MTRLSYYNLKPEPTTWGPYRPDVTLAAVLEAARAAGSERVMLTGDAPPRDWFMSAAPGWDAVRVFLDHETPAARYVHTATRAGVEVRRAAEWFGSGDYTFADARDAWEATHRILAKSGRSGASMFRSPGATGLDLWLRAHNGDVPDPLPLDMQEEIRATTAQHRIELRPPVTRDVPGLWVVDGRWMYASLVSELGSGPARRLTAAQATELADRDEYARARYLVRFTAPDYWEHLRLPGLILAPAGPLASDGWHAPTAGEAWVDASELLLARRWEWRCEILEGIEYTRGRPLDTWRDRIVRARAAADDLEPRIAPLVRFAVRAVLLHAIGSFHSSGRSETAVTASPMQRPDGDGWSAPDRLEDGRAVWKRPAPQRSDRALAMQHPEWSAAVWGRAHARILEGPTSERGRHSGALYVNPRELVSIYGDAIVTTSRPDWASLDDGKPGRLRIKGHMCGPLPWPTTAHERDEISRSATAIACEKGCK